MKKTILLSCIAIMGMFLLTNCNKEDEEEPELTAVITVVSSATPGDTIIIDGSQSVGENLRYEWTVTGPIDVTLSCIDPSIGCSSEDPSMTFVAEINGTYNIELRVTSGNNFHDASSILTVTGSKTLSGTLTENMTLSDIGDSTDYVITEDLIIPSGITLTIEPQTTLRFADGVGLIVEGTLNADIAEFKAYGTNWKGIYFKSTGSGNLPQCIVDKGGSASYTSVADENANITVATGSSYSVLGVNQGSITISNSAGYGIVMEDGSFPDENQYFAITFNANTKGPGIFTAFVALTNNNFNPNLNNTIAGTYINVRGSSSLGNATFKIQDLPYMVLGDITASGRLISYSTNTIVYFADGVGVTVSYIEISGGTFSSINQVAGSWKGIFCNLTGTTTANTFKNATIEYAGSSAFTYNSVDYTGAITGGTSWSISDANISNNTGFGLSVWSVWPMTITNSTINDNSVGALMVPFDEVDEIVGSTSNNTFTGYANVPIIWVIAPYNGNAQNALGTWIDIDSTMVTSDQVDYRMTTNATIENYNELILEAGVTVQFESDAYWDVIGMLTANGTSVKHVRLIGEGASTATGLWKGIYLNGYYSNSGLSLNYTDIIGGGADTTGNYQGNINLGSYTNDSISIINSQITYSGKYGIYDVTASDNYNLKDAAHNNYYTGNVTSDWNF